MKRRSSWRLPASFLFIGILFLGSAMVGLTHRASSVERGGFESHIPAQDSMLQVGEELEYEVSYSFFTIGTIRIKVVDKEVRNGNIVYKSQAFIDSNPSLSWLVDLHIRFYSEMDERVFSYQWISDDSTKKEINFKWFKFDYENNRVLCDKGKKLPTGERKVEEVDTIAVTESCEDGLSLFFYARENVRQQKQVRVPTLIEKKQEYTFINFMNKRTGVEIDAVNYPVEVVEFDGKAEYVGVFGLTGGFRGWFSNDAARVPILARMNVILGSIRIELVKWNRAGWQPRRYVEEPDK